MQVVLKWVAQFLLIPLIQKFIVFVYEYRKNQAELKKLRAEYDLKVKSYEAAKTIDASVEEFEKLP